MDAEVAREQEQLPDQECPGSVVDDRAIQVRVDEVLIGSEPDVLLDSETRSFAAQLALAQAQLRRATVAGRGLSVAWRWLGVNRVRASTRLTAAPHRHSVSRGSR